MFRTNGLNFKMNCFPRYFLVSYMYFKISYIKLHLGLGQKLKKRKEIFIHRLYASSDIYMRYQNVYIKSIKLLYVQTIN